MPKEAGESPSLETFKTCLDKLPKEAGCSAKKPGFFKILVMVVFVCHIGILNIIKFW